VLEDSVKSKPKILLWDIETSLNEVRTFDLWNTNIPHIRMQTPWIIFCAAWKWVGQKTIHTVSLLDDMTRFSMNHMDDGHVVEVLYGVLAEADAIVAHNGDKFDIKKFNTRAIKHGFDPLPNIVQIDTLKMAKQKFSFPYNRLDYLGEFLGVGRKVHTEPELWDRCMDGDQKALKAMVKYNKGDITLLEAVYDKLSPWVPTKLNMNHFSEGLVCPKCGGDHVTRHKRRLTRVGAMIQFQCQGCGHYFSAPENKKGELGLAR